jgi:anti-sigma factor RsiW
MMLRLRGLARRQLMSQRAVELVTHYLEEALSRADRRKFEKHLVGCSHCTEYLAQIRATISVTGRVTLADLSPPMRADFVQLYQRWRDDQEDSVGR